MQGALFDGVKQWNAECDGVQGKTPTFYFDNTSMTAIFTASTKKIRPILPHPAMHPVELFPGRCLIGFTAFEYRRLDIEPYNEFSIAILISYGSRPIPGATILSQLMNRCYSAYVWHLPVTTELARRAGVELYGYPKFIADITFKREKDVLECALAENGIPILTMRGRTRKTKAGGQMRYRTFSVKDGVPLCANIYTNPLEFAQTMSGDAAEITLAEAHPIAKELAGIGLSKKPLMFQYSPMNEIILFAPRNLMDN